MPNKLIKLPKKIIKKLFLHNIKIFFKNNYIKNDLRKIINILFCLHLSN